MASKLSLSEEDFSCPVCFDIFKDPVILSCSHSLCKACLQEWWGEKLLKECPVCNERHSSVDPPRNLALKNLCEAFNSIQFKGHENIQERNQTTSTEPLCRLHAEKLKLYCLKCQLPICVVCRDSGKHPKHRFRPIDEAARFHTSRVQKSLNALLEKLELFNKLKTYCDQTAEHIKIQTQHTEMQMREQFKKLHLFLQEEEEASITALREEEQQKSQMMKEKVRVLNRDITTVSNTIRAVEEQLRAEHISLLQNSEHATKKILKRLQDPQPVSGALIDKGKHLNNLTFRVWDKMKDIVSYTPVILDPDTAYPGLILSDDLTSVRYGETPQLPHNQGRCGGTWHLVLGSEGFNSGTHCWDVEVEHNTDWRLGVLTESYQRKRAGPGTIWSIYFFQGKYVAETESSSGGVTHTNGTFLPVQKNLKRVRVQLDWNKELSFSDADTNTHLFTFTHTHTFTLYPFIGNAHTVPLKILPRKVSVTLGQHS